MSKLSYQTLDSRVTVLEDKIEALRMILLTALSLNLPSDDRDPLPDAPTPDLPRE